MHTLYPPVEPFHQGTLQVSQRHRLYFEQVGTPQGLAAVFLHGGPGGGLDPFYRRFFNPQQWHLVLFEQRGCGRSQPYAELEDNTTWDLVEDIERLRQHLGIERWLVFGGSWGSTLALAYSQCYPERCTALILRGIFMLRRQELQWFYQYGAHYFFPEAWQAFLAPIPVAEHHDLLTAYRKRLTSTDQHLRLAAAQAWSRWEATTMKLEPDNALIEHFSQPQFAEAFARIENHYFIHGGFFDPEDQLLRQVNRIRHIPAVIVQGRYDVICPPISAWELHQAWPESELIMVADAGHALSEPGIQAALLAATAQFAHKLNESR
ncbi:MAG: prolyl aminopeptidase [Pseudomonadota bacterium]|nr:prolyl aminopeptidase [Pseudomonadota bacterium]